MRGELEVGVRHDSGILGCLAQALATETPCIQLLLYIRITCMCTISFLWKKGS